MNTHFFTFFSFKGGVGRSMAILNVAHSLVARGRDVLIIDLDLEAPGIANYLETNEEISEPCAADILDLLSWAKAASMRSKNLTTSVEDLLRDAPPLDLFTASVNSDKVMRSGVGTRARLDVIGAKLSSSTYLSRLSKLSLGSIDKKHLIAMSSLIKQLISSTSIPIQPSEAFGAMGNAGKHYDYVLIDSRTGFSEIGSLCVGPLADHVVLFSALNEQNITGTQRFMDTVGLEVVENPREYHGRQQPKSSSQHKASLLVVSPVPLGELAVRDARLTKMLEHLGPVAAKLTYHPEMAIKESNFVRDHPEEYLAMEYRDLTTKMMAMVGDDFASLEREIRSQTAVKRRQVEEEEDRALAEGRVRLIESKKRYLPLVRATSSIEGVPTIHLSNTPYYFVIWKILRIYAESPSQGESVVEDTLAVLDERSFEDCVATDRLYEVLSRRNTFESWRLWTNWGICLRSCVLDFKKNLDSVTIDRLLASADQKFATAESLARRDIELINVLPLRAGVLAQRADRLEPPRADELFDEAREKLRQVLGITTSVPTLRQIGHTYRDQAEKYSDGSRIDELFNLAYKAYGEADAADVYRHDASTDWSWARALQFHARKKTGEDMHNLFRQAYQKFEKAQFAAPKEVQITAQWGEALLDEAKRTSDQAEANRMLTHALAKLNAGRNAEKDYPEIKNAFVGAEELARQLRSQSSSDEVVS